MGRMRRCGLRCANLDIQASIGPMPTNLINPRKPDASAPARARSRVQKPVRLVLQAGPVTVDLALLDTPTAARIVAALPLFGVAEPWGGSVHFRLPIESGRERGARINANLGEVYYWSEEDRVIIPFGPTPISRDHEIRLPRPCNPWATIAADVTILRRIAPGAKVTLKA